METNWFHWNPMISMESWGFYWKCKYVNKIIKICINFYDFESLDFNGIVRCSWNPLICLEAKHFHGIYLFHDNPMDSINKVVDSSKIEWFYTNQTYEITIFMSQLKSRCFHTNLVDPIETL